MKQIKNGWFSVSEIESGVFLIKETSHVQSYLVTGSRKAALIDTGMGFCPMKPVIVSLTNLPVMVLNTHWHFDHIGGNPEFDTVGISEIDADLAIKPITNEQLTAAYLQSCLDQQIPLPQGFVPEQYKIQSPAPRFHISHGDLFDLGGRTLEAIATPGHTRGSLSFLDSRTGALFCGDLLYDGTLYAHFIDSDLDAYMDSLERTLSRAGNISHFYGGHNEPLLDRSFAGRVLQVMVQIRQNALKGYTMDDWGTPVDFFSSDGIDILVKQEGSAGVHLFDPQPRNPSCRQ